jgi:hypothetical protein
LKPRYTLYIPSKGRPQRDHSLTTSLLEQSELEFVLVVEPQDADAYAETYGRERLVELPFRDKGIAATRSWIKDHSIERGERRHWQLDDNLRRFCQFDRGARVTCTPALALSSLEQFVDRYENVAIAGFKNIAFGKWVKKPFQINQQVYCCVLVDNSTPHRWRGPGCEDTDYSIQVLTDGLCTVLINVFQIEKTATGKMKGGNTDAHYQDDGRLERARWLEREWPAMATVVRRNGRPSMEVRGWSKFPSRLIRKAKP